MSTTVTYKGNTLTTVDNATKVLTTQGKYLEDDITLVDVSGGVSKNIQAVQGTTRTPSATATAIGAEMTVAKTGIYDVYWSGFRSNTTSSYTFGTQLYIDDVAYGTENAVWTNHIQNNHLSNVPLSAGQKLRVRGRNSRGATYYIYAPTLVIAEV